MRSLFNKLQERAKLWDMKDVYTGGANYSAPNRPWFINDQQKKTGMKPGEFRIRKRKGPWLGTK